MRQDLVLPYRLSSLSATIGRIRYRLTLEACTEIILNACQDDTDLAVITSGGRLRLPATHRRSQKTTSLEMP